MNFKDIFYSICCLSFTIIIGGAVYEHLAVVPRWSAGPPASLTMFQGKYGLNPGPFWLTIHPISIGLLIANLIASWKTSRRFNLVVTFVGYVVILAVTAIYFVPELLEITNTPYSNTVNNDLTERSKLWELLSIVRLFILIVLSILLFLGLTKTVKQPIE